MSLISIQLGWLTLRPRISETKDTLTIKTGWIVMLLTLGLWRRRVEISPWSQIVKIRTTTGHLFRKTRTVRFQDIWYVDYSYDSLGTSWGWDGTGIGRHDLVEEFGLSLVLKNGESVGLCSFQGEGAACTGWGGVLLGDDDGVDLEGTQDEESKRLARYVAALLKVPIGKPMNDFGEMVECKVCGRKTSCYKEECLYCGALLDRTEPGNTAYPEPATRF